MRPQSVGTVRAKRPYEAPSLTKRDRLASITAEDTFISGGKDPG
jgi:hypothetical protein